MKQGKKSRLRWFIGLYFVSLMVFAAAVGILHGLMSL